MLFAGILVGIDNAADDERLVSRFLEFEGHVSGCFTTCVALTQLAPDVAFQLSTVTRPLMGGGIEVNMPQVWHQSELQRVEQTRFARFVDANQV